MDEIINFDPVRYVAAEVTAKRTAHRLGSPRQVVRRRPCGGGAVPAGLATF